MGCDAPYWHATDTIDYIVMLRGEVVLTRRDRRGAAQGRRFLRRSRRRARLAQRGVGAGHASPASTCPRNLSEMGEQYEQPAPPHRRRHRCRRQEPGRIGRADPAGPNPEPMAVTNVWTGACARVDNAAPAPAGFPGVRDEPADRSGLFGDGRRIRPRPRPGRSGDAFHRYRRPFLRRRGRSGAGARGWRGGAARGRPRDMPRRGARLAQR